MRVLSRGLVAAVLTFAAACGDNLSVPADGAPPDGGGVTLVSIAITPPAPSIADGTILQLTATATFSDSTTSDVTATATWSSSDPTIATVVAGSVTALDPGLATMTATVGTVMGSTDVTVTDATLVSLEISPTDSSVALGLLWPFTATGTFSDASVQNLTDQVTWSSSDETVATIDAAGLATTLAVGTTTIGADFAGVSAQTPLTVTDATLVSIQVTPIDPSVALGVDPQLTATGTFSDTSVQNLTDQVTWSSSDETVATIDAAGLATTLATGTTTISADLGGVMGTTELTVTTATLVSIQVTPVNPSIALGLDQQLTATGTFSDSSTQDITTQVLWTSSVETIAQVSNAAGTEGLATSLAVGTTTITAAMGGIMGTTDLTVSDAVLVSIDVTPDDPTVALGVDQQFTAIGTFTDLSTQDITTQVTWSSSDDTVAQVSNAPGSAGLATTLANGTTTITATMGAISGSSDLTVTGATLVSIDVTPLDPSVALGLTQQFTATGNFSDSSTQNLTTQVTWSSSDDTVAQISSAPGSEGLATTLALGTTTITATFGAISGTSDLTVTGAVLQSIAVTPPTATIFLDQTQQYTAMGTFSDLSTMDITTTVTWDAQPTTVAQISNAAGSEGLATPTGTGTAMITAQSGTITSPAVTLTVTAPAVIVALPPDGAVGARTMTPIVLVFDTAMDPASMTAQLADGACAGSVQLSRDGFASCVGFVTAAPVMALGDTVATFQPALLTPLATYRIRVLSTVTSGGGAPLGSPFTQPTGFTIETDGGCASSLVISQIYGAGGNSGATLDADFVELHNAGLAPVSLAGKALQYASSTGTSWQVTPLPAVTVPPGGYFVVRVSTVGANGAGFTFDHAATPSIAMAAGAGKVALTAAAIEIPAGTSCPVLLTLDFVGYGTTANCWEGTAPTPSPSTTSSVIRAGGGCPDRNNSTNFATGTPDPRDSTTPAFVCECTANETNVSAELDFCNLQFPPTMMVNAGGTTPMIFARAFEAGVTEAPGAGAGLTAQIGHGPSGVDPATMPGWSWSSAAFNVQVGNDDEYMTSLTAPGAAGTYAYTSRMSRDGTNWTYCDLNGAGSNAGLLFEPGQLGVLTVP